MFSVKAPPILHSYPINYSRVWFLLSETDKLMLAVQGSSQPASWGLANQQYADTMMPQPPALPLLPSGGYAVSDWCGCTLADTPFVLDCTAGVEIAAICSNSPVISICMRTWAIRSPLHKAQVLYLMLLITSLQVYSSTSLLVLPPKSGLAHAAEKALKKEKGILFSWRCKNLWEESTHKRMLNEHRWGDWKFDWGMTEWIC